MSSLEDVYDIGPVRAGSLRERGIESVEGVAAATIAELTALDGVGPARARKIRNSARRRLDDGGENDFEGDSPAPLDALSSSVLDASDGFATKVADALARSPSTESGDHTTDCAVAAADVVVVVPGQILVTAVGSTAYPDLFDAAWVSIPGESFLDATQCVLPESTPAAFALESAWVWFSPAQLAADAPRLYEFLVGGDTSDSTEIDAFPDAAVLSRTVSAISGERILDIRRQAPRLERELATLLANGTVLYEGSVFDFENPHQVSLLDDAGVYVPGDVVFPDGTLLSADTSISGVRSLPGASFLHPAVVSIPGDVVLDMGCLSVERDLSLLPNLSRCGVLLPPGSVRGE